MNELLYLIITGGIVGFFNILGPLILNPISLVLIPILIIILFPFLIMGSSMIPVGTFVGIPFIILGIIGVLSLCLLI